MNAYIDVRGPWPILIVGVMAITLEGENRSITVEDAMSYYLDEPDPLYNYTPSDRELRDTWGHR